MTHPNPTAQTVLRFLESVGRRSEAEFYLRLFRDLPRHGFGVIAPEANLAEETLPSLVEPLKFLSALQLRAVVLLGLFHPERSVDNAHRVAEALEAAGLRAASYEPQSSMQPALLRRDLDAERIPVVAMSEAQTRAERFGQVANLSAQLGTRKLVLLRANGGLHVRAGVTPPVDQLLEIIQGQISTVNVATDRRALAPLLEPEDESLLGHLAEVLSHPGCASLAVSIASPLDLLRELFTVRGSGTLVKRGSDLQWFSEVSQVDVERLSRLLEQTFGRPLRAGFFDAQCLQIVIEAGYRGAAIVDTSGAIPYLSKFAVERDAQGEGIGRDLWAALCRRFPQVYWRARRDNPAADWYSGLCDGMVKSHRWFVFFRGVSESAIPQLVRLAAARPEDFDEPT